MEMGGGTFTGGSRFGERFDRYKHAAQSGGGVQPIRRMVRPVQVTRTGGGWAARWDKEKKIITWDVAPGKEYFEALFRVSREQIIWGANYFELPPTRCFVVWEKTNVPENFSMAMAEYAWVSRSGNAKIWRGSAEGQKDRFHPTQKPVELYAWLLGLYAKPGMKILDTHAGSASSLIACRRAGCPAWGFEIDEAYYQKASERLARETAQQSLLDGL